jgi:hypothetical protein
VEFMSCLRKLPSFKVDFSHVAGRVPERPRNWPSRSSNSAIAWIVVTRLALSHLQRRWSRLHFSVLGPAHNVLYPADRSTTTSR